MNEGHARKIVLQALLRRGQRNTVAINADETAGRQTADDLKGMPRAAQRAVEVDSLRLDGQSIDALVQQHGFM